MAVVITKAVAFVGIILMGYLLKRGGFFQIKDFQLISRIVIYITLPAAIVSNFSKIRMDYSLLSICIFGIVCNLVTITAGYLMNASKGGEKKAFAMLNMSGYNVGNFTMPFVQNFLNPVGFATTSLFDAGNSVMCTGLTYSLADMAANGGGKASVKSVIKKLFSSVPFDTYVTMTVLSVCKIKLPSLLISFADTAGNANAFLALLMLGIGFEIRLEKEKLNQIVSVLAIRYGLAIIMAFAFYYFLPFEIDVRCALAIVSLGPVSSVAPAFTSALHGDVETASAINSLSIIISTIAITIALIILL